MITRIWKIVPPHRMSEQFAPKEFKDSYEEFLDDDSLQSNFYVFKLPDTCTHCLRQLHTCIVNMQSKKILSLKWAVKNILLEPCALKNNVFVEKK